MPGFLFDYTYGRVRVDFRHETFDDLRMRVRMRGASVTVTPFDSAWNRLESTVSPQSEARVDFRLSSSHCPFNGLIAWLEAVAVGCQNCSFEWDAAGPDARLGWESSLLRLCWFASDGEQDVTMRANRKQAVRAFYTAFRRFVASPRYHPECYERLRCGEAFVLAITHRFTEEELLGQLLAQSSSEAEAVLQDLHPLTSWEEDGCVTRKWIDDGWDRWSVPRRRRYLKEIFDFEGAGWHGAPLRRLRSPLIERWLSEPACSERSAAEVLCHAP